MKVEGLVLLATLSSLLPLPVVGAVTSYLSPCSGLEFDGSDWSGDTNVPGSGTEDDPYMLTGMEFDLRAGGGIRIERSSAWILISYCRFYYGEGQTALLISNSTDITIDTVVAARCSVGIRIDNSSGITIVNTTVYGGTDGIEVRGSSDVRIMRCLSTYNDRNGMTAFNSTDVRISHSSFDVNSPRLGSDQAMLLGNCSGTIITNTTFRMNYGNGITLLPSDGRSDLVVEDCSLENNVNGIWSRGWSISIANTAFVSNTHGILAVDCTDSNVRCSTFKGNDNGITIYDSTYMGVENCTFSKNGNCLRLMNSSLDWIVSNEFVDSTGLTVAIGKNGMGEDGSRGNLITRNTFGRYRGTGDEVLDMGDGNQWCDCVGGNYWSKVQGPDADGDGVVDGPRPIPGTAGSIDLHPMVIIQGDPDGGIMHRERPDEAVGISLAAFDALSIAAVLVLAGRAWIIRSKVAVRSKQV